MVEIDPAAVRHRITRLSTAAPTPVSVEVDSYRFDGPNPTCLRIVIKVDVVGVLSCSEKLDRLVLMSNIFVRA
jgi:hypothetical protein